jgi:DNA-binding SARP family transcriptional activator
VEDCISRASVSAQGEIARLEELRLAALEERIDAELRLGLHAELAGELEALVAEHPARERLCRQRMLALYRCGRQADALDAYQAARNALVDELGIEPSKDCATSTRRSCVRTLHWIWRPARSQRQPRRSGHPSWVASQSWPTSRPGSRTPSPATAACSCCRVSRGSERAGWPTSC